MSTYETPPLPTTAMIGVGSMSGAILQGLLTPGVKIDLPIRATTLSGGSAEQLSRLVGVEAAATSVTPDANRAAVQGAKVVVLGVKPWAVLDVLGEIAAHLEPDAVVISVAAGVTLERMERLVPRGVSVIRAMPNTPSMIGRGVTGLTAREGTPARAMSLARQLFETVGEVLVVDSEAQLNALTAVSGSGPAYVFFLIETFTAAAQRLGFSLEEARLLVEGTFLGASQLVKHEGEDPAELRRRVTSPNGTTERAMKILEEAGLDDAVDRALAAAVKRSEELARE